jgi:hypothetical protein
VKSGQRYGLRGPDLNRRPSGYEFTKAVFRTPIQAIEIAQKPQQTPGVACVRHVHGSSSLIIPFQIVKAPSGHRGHLNAISVHTVDLDTEAMAPEIDRLGGEL